MHLNAKFVWLIFCLCKLRAFQGVILTVTSPFELKWKEMLTRHTRKKNHRNSECSRDQNDDANILSSCAAQHYSRLLKTNIKFGAEYEKRVQAKCTPTRRKRGQIWLITQRNASSKVSRLSLTTRGFTLWNLWEPDENDQGDDVLE